jgi:hypothetical protein
MFSALPQGLIRRGRRGHPAGPHGSPGDAKHRPETALARLVTMRRDTTRAARKSHN